MTRTRSSKSAKSTPPPAKTGGAIGDKILAVLGLFSVERPEWTVEAVADELGVSVSTSYRYFKALTKAGLICPVSRATYTLGPAIIEMDRQIQICDPMLRAARSVMQDLIGYASEGSIILLCRAFRDKVMCVHQVVGLGPQMPLMHERGRVMPPFRTAVAKIILAHLPTRTLKGLFAADAREIAAAGLGRSWDEFRRKLAEIRRAGYCVTTGDIDASRIGVAAPILNREGQILGSIAFITSASRGHDMLMNRLLPLTVAGAREIERAMWDADSAEPGPEAARRKAAL